MRKLSLSFVFFFYGIGLVLAGGRKATVPEDQKGNPAYTADFVGVDIATAGAAFSTSSILLFSGEGSVVGFYASSAQANGDYVLFRSTNSVLGTNDSLVTDEVARVYMSSTPVVVSTTFGSTGPNGTSFLFPKPIRFRKGAAARIVPAGTNNGAVASIIYLFNSFQSP